MSSLFPSVRHGYVDGFVHGEFVHTSGGSDHAVELRKIELVLSYRGSRLTRDLRACPF
jgi:hypothetical protein